MLLSQNQKNSSYKSFFYYLSFPHVLWTPLEISGLSSVEMRIMRTMPHQQKTRRLGCLKFIALAYMTHFGWYLYIIVLKRCSLKAADWQMWKKSFLRLIWNPPHRTSTSHWHHFASSVAWVFADAGWTSLSLGCQYGQFGLSFSGRPGQCCCFLSESVFFCRFYFLYKGIKQC